MPVRVKEAHGREIATDGQQVIDYLAGEKDFADRTRFPLPFLIFLDLKLPYRDGFDVLAWMRQRPALQSIAVVVLTGSDETKDHHRAHELGARSYLVKPPSPADINQLADAMPNYWSRPTAASVS